ncbi:MAG: type IV toxin-antitoxin system AbiEi family antitoxin domain-containing protein [Dehalococcoidia bacterium]|nr:type IV toxin-antitoxin system AbiEi family antitoxin domain-containing protein [Dehalococcoidia bacterium]
MNRTNASPHGISEKNRKILTTLHRGTSGPFTPREAANLLGLDIARAQRFLAYLTAAGWLTRIRRGLYATVPLDVAEPISWREDPWIVAAKVFSPFYIGGWSACEHWGLTDQIFKETVVISGKTIRRRRIEIQGVPFYIRGVDRDKIFGTDTVWRGQTRVFVSDPTRTIVDVLDDPGIGGGIRHVADVLEAYLSHERRNDSLFVEYAHKLGNRTVFKRLGYLLEARKANDVALIKACHEAISSGISLLDPSAPRKGRFVRRWNLCVNIALDSSETTP